MEHVEPCVGVDGLFRLCRECITLYQEEVIKRGRDYYRFANSFLLSHQFHDATDAHSKNEHNMNLGTMRDLLLDNRPIVENHFRDGFTSNEQLALIFNELDRGENVASAHPFVSCSEPACQVRATDFEAAMSDELLEKITECINSCHLFTTELTKETVRHLFDCTLSSPVTCKNNRLVSLFFDGLRKTSVISRSWQKVIEKHKMFVKSDGVTYVSAHDLSVALYQINNKQATSLNQKMFKRLEEIYKLISSVNSKK